MQYVRIGKNLVNLDQLALVQFDTEDENPKKATLFFACGESGAPKRLEIHGDPAKKLFEYLNSHSDPVSKSTGEPPRPPAGSRVVSG